MARIGIITYLKFDMILKTARYGMFTNFSVELKKITFQGIFFRHLSKMTMKF